MNAFNRPAIFALLLAAPLLASADTSADRGPHYPDVVSLERSFETSSGFTLLPSSVPGTLTVNQCTGCRSTVLSVTAQTQFFIGPAQVPLAEFRNRLAGAPPTFMMVYADLKDPIARRVVLHAPPPAPGHTR